MAAYGPQIPEHDRWAIVAYIRALQRSRQAALDDVPEEVQEAMTFVFVDDVNAVLEAALIPPDETTTPADSPAQPDHAPVGEEA